MVSSEISCRLVLQRTHIVQTVTQLDEDDADVLGHGHEHLAQVLHLLILFGGILHPGQLGDTLHQFRHGLAEQAGHFIVGGVGILNAIMEHGRHNGVGIHAQFIDDLRHRDGVDDVGLAALAQLGAVMGIGIFKGSTDTGHVHLGIIGSDLPLKRFVKFQHINHLAAPLFLNGLGFFQQLPQQAHHSRLLQIHFLCGVVQFHRGVLSG